VDTIVTPRPPSLKMPGLDAYVVSAGTPLFEVRDAAGGLSLFGPVSAVRGPDTRMGSRDPAVLSRLRERDAEVAPALMRLLHASGPVDLWPLAVQGLVEGDDLHSRTAAANAALVSSLRRSGAGGEVADAIGATPLFFLSLWMAACALVLRAAEGGDRPGIVTRAGGNGERFAIALAGCPTHWVACDAGAPTGPLLPHVSSATAIAGAMGDSAVIDMLGFGGQRLAHAPEPSDVFRDHLPADHAALANRLLAAPHPLLPDAWPLGLDAERVVTQRAAPLVMLAMLADDGIGGLAGRGVYRPPTTLFEQALRNLG
jgi:hypothetical protein